MPYYQVPHYCGVYYVPHTTVINVYANVTPSWLPQVSLSTNSQLFDTSSRTVLTQTFVNPSKTNAIEKAKYNFPLYESCAVVAFRCHVGGRLIEGIVKGKEEAKVEYNEAVARGETAALLEQQTPDVFRTSLGNIPAGDTVRVEIEYIMELKHDAEVDGLRFTIPTSIAPRYGNAPSGLDTDVEGKPIAGALEKGGMKISVQVTMPSNVRSIQSPSHPISIHLGGHVENSADDDFNPMHALATLSQTSTELGADFVLLVKCVDLSSPRALLETHPTISNSKALMVTLVPKFTLPPGPKPEIVFVVDRSGSMGGRMEALKSALAVFLKSLPLGVKFNICSFGSNHSFLWKKSQPYSADTLQQAQKHAESMDADFGGTEILPPIEATVDRRYKDLQLEIMVLTDGEVWDTDPLFKYIEKATASGDVRVFSLGIGLDVSHSLVEGMARVGRGFAQIVSNEKEGIEGKVVRMLRGGLSAHVKDYRLEWEGRPTEEQAQVPGKKDKATEQAQTPVKQDKVTSTLKRAVAGVKQKISLFDKQADTDTPISAQVEDHLPAFEVPTILQAPYKIPPLFPFSRTTVYVILSGDVAPPTSVWLRGTTPSGDELELEIPVQVLPATAQTIHQLAARKILQELEEGTGYLHSGKYGVDKEKNAGTFDDWVAREGKRVGLTYKLASKWTSFVAVQKTKKGEKDVGEEKGVVSDKKEEETSKKEHKAAHDYRSLDVDTDVDDEDGEEMEDFLVLDDTSTLAETEALSAAPTGGATFALFSRAAAPSPSSQFRSSSMAAPPKTKTASWSPAFFGASRKYKLAAPASAPAPPPPPGSVSYSPPVAAMPCVLPALDSSSGGIAQASRGGAERSRRLSSSDKLQSTSEDETGYSLSLDDSSPGDSAQSQAAAAAQLPPVETTREKAVALIALQSFEGSFLLTGALASILAVPLADLETKLTNFVTSSGTSLQEPEKKKLWATVLALSMFEGKLMGEKEMWELVAEKARDWISTLAAVQKDVENLEALAMEVLA